MSDAPKLPMREWAGSLVAGALLLALTLLLASLFVGDVRDAIRPCPNLSPATISEFELDERHGQLVDVSGFELDCDAAAFDGETLLAPALGPAGELIFVRFEHGSDCRELELEFRGEAKAMSVGLERELGLGDSGLAPPPIVEPHEAHPGILAVMLALAGLGVFTIYSAFATRKRKLAELTRVWTPAAAEGDQRAAANPYRPELPGRLITEKLALAPAFFARLRRARRAQAGVGAVLIAGALITAGWGGQRIYERERVWAEGIPAEDAVAGGEVRRSLLIVVRTKLDVTYVDQAGRVHREQASATSFIVGVDDSRQPEVRYLPDEPERFAVSWIHELRVGSIVLLVIGFLAQLAGGIALTISARRDRRPEQAQAIFEDPREALLELLSIERVVVNGNETGAVTYQFRIRESERGWRHGVGPKDPPPLFLDESETVALGLYHAEDPDFLLVLSEDLREIAGSPVSPAQLRGRYRGVGVEGS